jgi:hypothetical protein
VITDNDDDVSSEAGDGNVAFAMTNKHSILTNLFIRMPVFGHDMLTGVVIDNITVCRCIIVCLTDIF